MRPAFISAFNDISVNKLMVLRGIPWFFDRFLWSLFAWEPDFDHPVMLKWCKLRSFKFKNCPRNFWPLSGTNISNLSKRKEVQGIYSGHILMMPWGLFIWAVSYVMCTLGVAW
jgi:hypothetical protein